MRSTILKLATVTFLAAAAALSTSDADATPRPVTPSGTGFQGVYGAIPADQAEFLSSPDAIKSAAASAAPTKIWETLEHGEFVECLDCIPFVAPLLYDANAKNREIAAWWLRRRIFGVFGAGEVYEQTLSTLASDSDPLRRMYAANAVGEFLTGAGVPSVAQALLHDGDPRVRAASASALGRLNDDGAGALGTAMGDTDPSVKLAALGAAGRINSFSGLSQVAALTTDATPEVRRRAIEVLDGLHATDAIVPVSAAAQKDADPRVRAMACHALGVFGDSSVTTLLTNLSQNDPDQFVRDEASIALKRI
ncbi:MAG TPA: HEAT repeat domain-containing protein [Polyangiaceae bacterium]